MKIKSPIPLITVSEKEKTKGSSEETWDALLVVKPGPLLLLQ